MLADGKVNAAPLVTGTVGLESVEEAFDALADPEAHAKILIDPGHPATGPRSPRTDSLHACGDNVVTSGICGVVACATMAAASLTSLIPPEPAPRQ